MPIDLRTHDPDDQVDIDPGTNKAKLVQYLYMRPNLGFKPAELNDDLDMPKGSITTTLVRLSDEGLIGKTADGYYHALESRKDVRRFVTGLVQATTLHDRYDDLSPEDVDITRLVDPAGTTDVNAADDVEAELDELEE